MSLKVKTSEAHARVAERFKKLGDYKDAKIYVASHEAAAEKLRVIEAEQNKKTRRYGFFDRMFDCCDYGVTTVFHV